MITRRQADELIALAIYARMTIVACSSEDTPVDEWNDSAETEDARAWGRFLGAVETLVTRDYPAR